MPKTIQGYEVKLKVGPDSQEIDNAERYLARRASASPAPVQVRKLIEEQIDTTYVIGRSFVYSGLTLNVHGSRMEITIRSPTRKEIGTLVEGLTDCASATLIRAVRKSE